MLLLMVLNDEIRDAMGDRFTKHKNIRSSLVPRVTEKMQAIRCQNVERCRRLRERCKGIQMADFSLFAQSPLALLGGT
jgi:hypothetical protein